MSERSGQAERERQDKEKADEVRRRQLRQVHISEESGSEGEESDVAAEESEAAKPKTRSRKKSE